MYNNPRYALNQQNMYEQIDNQINQLQQMKDQMRNNVPAINQTFQLAPSNHSVRFANTIDDVMKEQVFSDTPFFSQDMSVVWIKNTKNQIKTYELKEIIPKDDKDLQIEYLTNRLEQLERKMNYEQSNTNVNQTEVSEYTNSDDESTGEPIKEDESKSISRVSKSKTK